MSWFENRKLFLTLVQIIICFSPVINKTCYGRTDESRCVKIPGCCYLEQLFMETYHKNICMQFTDLMKHLESYYYVGSQTDSVTNAQRGAKFIKHRQACVQKEMPGKLANDLIGDTNLSSSEEKKKILSCMLDYMSFATSNNIKLHDIECAWSNILGKTFVKIFIVTSLLIVFSI